jgi:CRISPR-associated protein Csx10
MSQRINYGKLNRKNANNSGSNVVGAKPAPPKIIKTPRRFPTEAYADQGQIELTLTFKSDWHIGTGTGIPGYIDALVKRDANRLPFMPGKSLHGVWRDACETVADALGENWPSFVHVVFGRKPNNDAAGDVPYSSLGALTLPSLHLSDAVRAKVMNQQLHAQLTTLRPGIAIEDTTGQAKTDMLRIVEMAVAGSVLHGQAELTLVGDSLTAAHALLYGGTKLLQSIGGDRRRGAGSCELEMRHAAAQRLIERLSKPAPSKIERAEPVASVAIPKRESAQPTFTLDLVLDLLQPVCVAKATVGNVVHTLDFIPGTQLLPALMPHLAARANGRNEVLRELIAAGEIQIRHAYPSIDGKRASPLPMCLHAEKTNSKQVVNIATHHVKETPQLKQLRGKYGYLSQKLIVGAATLTQHTHSAIQEQTQRPTSDVGGIYIMETLAQAQRLRAQFYCSANAASALGWMAEDFRGLAGVALHLGIAKKTDYGTVRVSTIENAIEPPKPIGNSLWLTCLSDWLLLDEAMRPRANANEVKCALQKALRELDTKQKQEQSIADIKCELQHSFVRMRRTEGFHTASVLARPSYVGVMAGSCYRIVDVDPNLSPLLNALQHRGLGARRGEGYGQISFSDRWSITQAIETLTREIDGIETTPESPLAMTTEEQKWVADINRVKARATIDRLVEALVRQPDFICEKLNWSAEKPSAAQLGTLREYLLQDDIDRWRALFVTDPQRNYDPEKINEKWGSAKDFWREDYPLESLFNAQNNANFEWNYAAKALFIAAFSQHRKGTQS